MTYLRYAAPVLAAMLFCGDAPPVQAQGMAAATSEWIQVAYDPPSDPQFRQLYDDLTSRRVLERLQGFMAPLRLAKTLTIRVAQCGAESMPYKIGSPVTICYEMVQKIAGIANQKAKDRNEQAQILYGTFVQAVLHQVAYAIFDQFEVPIWGRLDDAADQVAALIMSKFGDKVALTTIIGTAKFFEYSGRTWTGDDFARPDSPESQRFYNYLCIAYGADPITFYFLKPRPGPGAQPRLTSHRAERCEGEYLQVKHAFDLRIMPYVDPDLMLKVRASQWLKSDELPEVVQ
jgi:hypothetical protein